MVGVEAGGIGGVGVGGDGGVPDPLMSGLSASLGPFDPPELGEPPFLVVATSGM